VEIDIPKGINDGDNVRYPGIAPGGQDLIIQFRIHPDPNWQRQDLDLIGSLTVSVWDLVLGADIPVTDITGVNLIATVPPRTQPKTMLRLRGKGINDRSGRVGDILLRIDAVIPNNIDPELISAISKYKK
jgi:molecular chaperone DnaJ